MKQIYLLLSALFFFSPAYSQVFFLEVADAAGVGEVGYNYGVSIIDYDNDGWEDVYLTRRQGPNRLYRNQGTGSFTEVAAAAGLDYAGDCRLAVWGDINNDGHLDVYLGTVGGGDRLYLNNGNGTFAEISLAAGMYAGKSCIGAMMGDIDNDGLIDLYCARLGDQNTLYRNLGNQTFSDITYAAGATDTLVAMGAMFVDYDRDGDQDMYLVHDAYGPNILYQNDGFGHFTNVAEAAGVDYAGFGMGVDAGDVNHDGWPDLYVSNLYHNVLYLNNGDGTFTDISADAGVDDNGMGWSTAFLDADNDSWQDIYLSNTPSYPNVLYRNKGDNTFEIMSANTAIGSNGNGFGMACGDLNNDGRVDIFVANSVDNRGNELFRNESTSGLHWAAFHLTGVSCNRAAIGAVVEVKANGFWQSDAVIAGSGWSSQNSLILHFGLGTATAIDSVIIRWPGGAAEYLENLPADQLYAITETAVPTEIETVSLWSRLSVLPNPFGDRLSLRFVLERPGSVQVWLTDLAGREVDFRHWELPAGPQELELAYPSLAPGMYLCRMLTDEGMATAKMRKAD